MKSLTDAIHDADTARLIRADERLTKLEIARGVTANEETEAVLLGAELGMRADLGDDLAAAYFDAIEEEGDRAVRDSG